MVMAKGPRTFSEGLYRRLLHAVIWEAVQVQVKGLASLRIRNKPGSQIGIAVGRVARTGGKKAADPISLRLALSKNKLQEKLNSGIRSRIWTNEKKPAYRCGGDYCRAFYSNIGVKFYTVETSYETHNEIRAVTGRLSRMRAVASRSGSCAATGTREIRSVGTARRRWMR
jgi:hypothetical protein